ncbi:MAG: DUF3108 domain-containing protein [Candidatus Cloacimonetes bacterium]|nr:DUF3108 domain-containing protein [Candidatus Cloacimonadota bacterium]
MKRIVLASVFCLGIMNLWSIPAGEKLTFNIKYGMISAATATMEFREISYQDTIPCYEIMTRTRTNSFFDKIFKVRDEISSIIDQKLFVSHRFEKILNEGKYRQHRIHLYYPDMNFTFYLKYSRKKGEFNRKKMEIPDNTQDILSAFYWAREQNLAAGDSLLINVTVDGLNTVTKVIVHGTENIETIFGETECLVIEPLLQTEAVFKQTGRVVIWLTNDENKTPVKLESQVIFGKFKAILEKAEYKS